MITKYSAAYWKENLQLQSHVEGGAFREIYRSELLLPRSVLSTAHKGSRNASTSIYFLLQYGEFSAFHRIASDELWHFYDGDTLCIYEINAVGVMHRHLLGRNMDNGESLQLLIKAGSWFASRVEVSNGYALCGCTVAPGFDFEDFELAGKKDLMSAFPLYSQLIDELTY